MRDEEGKFVSSKKSTAIVMRQKNEIERLEEENDALRSIIAGADAKRTQRAAALFCLCGVLMAASAGPPFLVVLALVAASAGVVSIMGNKK